MARKARLDAELVRRKLARSRDHAAALITEGKVTVAGMAAKKAATAVSTDAAIVVRDEDDPGWASRGAHKLLGALTTFEPRGLSVEGKRCLDAGASTGGFTDVLLRRGAKQVIAADVGRGQLDWRLRTDERVVVLDKTNVRSLTAADIGGPVELIVADLSFISLRLVLPALAACALPGADLLPMIKPQFEVGKDRLGSGGVVREPELRAGTVLDVLTVAGELGLRTAGVVASPLPGPSGNVEYFAWLRSVATDATASTQEDRMTDEGETSPAAVEALVRAAIAGGPA
ncbi:MAG: TlyA family rRNA (cytidine-2'-O)-methyltransferase [Actinophytocola sp.]|nr:TlyA family rRNA (cytidine-2'-O)-methyltransferase [Actinophytocola sp.]